MKSYLKIKGKKLWLLCAVVLLGIIIDACYVKILNIDQPPTAKVGDIVTIKIQDTIQTNISNGCNCVVANYVLGILLPKGWDGAHNVKIHYTSAKGNGDMSLMPAGTLEPSNGKNLTWSAAMKAKFGKGRNLVDDMEWVVFQSNQAYTINNEDQFRADATISLTVGADGNDTYAFPAYCIAESNNGLDDDITNGSPNPMYNEASGGCLVVTNGTTGDIHDYCNQQLTNVDPPKALDNEFVTVNYNNKLDTTALNTLKGNNNLFICVDSVFTSDGKALTGFCAQTPKTQLVQTASGSGVFRITLWPRSFFSLTATQSLTRMTYYVTDATGTKKIGYGGNPNVPFSYKYTCN